MYSELCNVYPEGRADFYRVLHSWNQPPCRLPQQIKIGSEGQVLLGIVNHEAKTTNYSIEIDISGMKVNEIGTLTLGVGEKWEHEVIFVPQNPGTEEEVEFILYKNGDTQPYMEPLHLWINVTQ